MRSINCDRCSVADRDSLGGKADAFLMVVDGMGANRRGDTASRIAAEVVPEALRSNLDALSADPTGDELASALRNAVAAANLAVWKRAQEDAELKGMATTCVAALARGGSVLLCHAGDSRGYWLSGDELIQVTADHSLIQEVVPSDDVGVSVEDRFGAVITRGIGLSRSVETDLEVVRPGPRDALLLCTDGLSNMVGDRAIAAALAGAACAEDACEKLIAIANEAGGLDNVGVAVLRGSEFAPYTLTQTEPVQAREADRGGRRSRSRRSRCAWAPPVAAILGILCVVLAVALAYVWWDRDRLLTELERAPRASTGVELQSGGGGRTP